MASLKAFHSNAAYLLCFTQNDNLKLLDKTDGNNDNFILKNNQERHSNLQDVKNPEGLLFLIIIRKLNFKQNLSLSILRFISK